MNVPVWRQNQNQLTKILTDRFNGLSVCYEHDTDSSSRLGTVTSAYIDTEGNLCCNMEIDTDCLPGRVASKFLNEGLKNSTSLRHDICKMTEPGSSAPVLGKVLKEVSL